jgi:hypothetical protein
MKARGASCGTVSLVRPSAVDCIVPAHLPHALLWHSIGAAAQHGVPADRFAHEIGAFLKLPDAARSRQLNAKPLDGNSSVI